MTRRNNREAPPPAESLADLEAELHARQHAATDTPDRGDTETLLAFIRDYPGVTAKEVILHGRGSMTYSRADTLLNALVASGELRADPPGIPFHGCLRLYVISQGLP